MDLDPKLSDIEREKSYEEAHVVHSSGSAKKQLWLENKTNANWNSDDILSKT